MGKTWSSRGCCAMGMSALFKLRECENWMFNRADKREKTHLKFYGSMAGNILRNEISCFALKRGNRYAYRASVRKPGGK